MGELLLMAWDPVAEEYVKVRCDENGNLLVGDIEVDKIRLIPQASVTGAEGTLFYDSDDDHIHVATE